MDDTYYFRLITCLLTSNNWIIHESFSLGRRYMNDIVLMKGKIIISQNSSGNLISSRNDSIWCSLPFCAINPDMISPSVCNSSSLFTKEVGISVASLILKTTSFWVLWSLANNTRIDPWYERGYLKVYRERILSNEGKVEQSWVEMERPWANTKSDFPDVLERKEDQEQIKRTQNH